MESEYLFLICVNLCVLCGENLLYFCKILVKQRYRPYSVEKLFHRVVLVGRMDGIRFKAKTHQDRFDAQHLFEGGDNRDTSAAADRKWPFAIYIKVGFFGSLIGRKVNWATITVSAMQVGYFHFYRVWGQVLEMFFEQNFNLFVILIRD